MEEVLPTCLCGDPALARELPADDELTGERFTYLKCANCGLERLSPRPSLQAIQRYYPDDYAPYQMAHEDARWLTKLKHLVYLTFWATQEERPKVIGRLRWLLIPFLAPLRTHTTASFRPPAARFVFEFGAASGGNLLDFRALGWRIAGCEPSLHACEIAANCGVALQNCAAEMAKIPEGVTCIYMNNVFEHLHYPLAVLEKSHAALMPGGVLVLIVPNHNSWSARLFGAAWPGYDPPRHLWGYTPRSICLLLTKTGFDLVSIGQRFPLSDYCWYAGINGYRLRTRPPWRISFARLMRRTRILVPLGALAAFFCSGDYLYIVAQKGCPQHHR
jgi:SAM-dependent methyltransferase